QGRIFAVLFQKPAEARAETFTFVPNLTCEKVSRIVPVRIVIGNGDKILSENGPEACKGNLAGIVVYYIIKILASFHQNAVNVNLLGTGDYGDKIFAVFPGEPVWALVTFNSLETYPVKFTSRHAAGYVQESFVCFAEVGLVLQSHAPALVAPRVGPVILQVQMSCPQDGTVLYVELHINLVELFQGLCVTIGLYGQVMIGNGCQDGDILRKFSRNLQEIGRAHV